MQMVNEIMQHKEAFHLRKASNTLPACRNCCEPYVIKLLKPHITRKEKLIDLLSLHIATTFSIPAQDHGPWLTMVGHDSLFVMIGRSTVAFAQ